MTNKTKQNQVKENTSKLVGLSDQLSHNTCGNGNGATTNKLPRRGKTKMFKCIEFYINPFSLTRAPLIAKMARVAINKRRMKKRQKICGSLSQHVLFSSTIDSFGNKDDRRGERN